MNSSFATQKSVSRPLHAALFTLLALASVNAGAGDAATAIQNSKLAIDRQGIKVWTYQTANNPAFNYKATTTVHSSPSTVAALILDPDAAPKWAPYVHKIDVISPPDANGLSVFRMELDLPFPLQDRDVVIKAQLTQAADGSMSLNSEAVSDARAPKRDGIVRVTNYKGNWSLRALGNGQVEVTTSGYADLGGAIPLAFANLFVQQQPYQMLQNMRQHLEQVATKKARPGADLVASR